MKKLIGFLAVVLTVCSAGAAPKMAIVKGEMGLRTGENFITSVELDADGFLVLNASVNAQENLCVISPAFAKARAIDLASLAGQLSSRKNNIFVTCTTEISSSAAKSIVIKFQVN